MSVAGQKLVMKKKQWGPQMMAGATEAGSGLAAVVVMADLVEPDSA